jgi:hypothetical protein
MSTAIKPKHLKQLGFKKIKTVPGANRCYQLNGLYLEYYPNARHVWVCGNRTFDSRYFPGGRAIWDFEDLEIYVRDYLKQK